jgi:hypothetical protein
MSLPAVEFILECIMGAAAVAFAGLWARERRRADRLYAALLRAGARERRWFREFLATQKELSSSIQRGPKGRFTKPSSPTL